MTRKPVWIWLPGASSPTLAGHLACDPHGRGRFHYDPAYLDAAAAVPLDPVSLRFSARKNGIAVLAPDGIPGVIRDAAPSGYGAELLSQAHDASGRLAATGGLLPLLDLLELGDDDAVGALAACDDIERKLARRRPTFGDLAAEVRQLDADRSPARAIRRLAGDGGTSAGGERPKITVEHEGRLWLAKMQDRADLPFLPAKEFVCMSLAGACGIRVPEVRLEPVAHTQVFLVERFDRHGDPRSPCRRLFASARTVLNLPLDAVKGDPRRSYLALADGVSQWARHGAHSAGDRQELWKRMCFNALVGNHDDHPLNHGVLLQPEGWRLSPAFDITPLRAFKGILSMATGIDGLAAASPQRLLAAAEHFDLALETARQWLQDSAERIAAAWQSLLIQHGVPQAEVDRCRDAFALSTMLSDNPALLSQLAAATPPRARRWRTSRLAPPRGEQS